MKLAAKSKQPPPQYRQERKKKPHLWAFLFLAPTVILMAIWNYYPLINTIQISFQKVDLFGRPAGFAGFNNYLSLFQSGDFTKVLTRTFVFVIGMVIIKLVLGFAVALPLSSALRGTIFARPIVLIPMAFSGAVTAVFFKTMFAPKVGTFAQLLKLFHIPEPSWLTDPKWAYMALFITITWGGLGFIILLYMAALDSIPKEVMEASALDGVGWFKRIWTIQLPLISPTLFFLVITQTMGALKEFTTIFILTNGGPQDSTTTLTVQLYRLGFGTNVDFGRSAAYGLVLMILVGIVAFIQFRIGEKRVIY